MAHGSPIPLALRRALQKRMVALVNEMGSRLAVAAALDLPPRAIEKAERYGAVSPHTVEQLLRHLNIDEKALLEPRETGDR